MEEERQRLENEHVTSQEMTNEEREEMSKRQGMEMIESTGQEMREEEEKNSEEEEKRKETEQTEELTEGTELTDEMGGEVDGLMDEEMDGGDEIGLMGGNINMATQDLIHRNFNMDVSTDDDALENIDGVLQMNNHASDSDSIIPVLDDIDVSERALVD